MDQYILDGLIEGSLYALLALGLALVYNTTHIFHVAYGGLILSGPYFYEIGVEGLGISPFLAIGMAGISVCLFSWSIDVLVYRPLERAKAPPFSLILSSIGVNLVIVNGLAWIGGYDLQAVRLDASSFQFGSITLSQNQTVQFGLSIFILIGCILFLHYHSFGLKVRALRDDHQLVQHLGISPLRLRTYLFLGSGFLAFAGSMLIAYDGGLNTIMGTKYFLYTFVALVIGGIGRFSNVLWGGIILGILQGVCLGLEKGNLLWKDLLTFGLLLVFLQLRKQGIAGELRRTF